MKTTKPRSAEQETEQQGTETVGVRFQSEMIVREDVVIPFSDDGPKGQTLGTILDQHLMDLAFHDGEPSSFTFSFDKRAWEQAKPLYLAKYNEARENGFRDYN